MATSKISIIVPTFNKLEFLKPCLESIIKNTTIDENIEIIVVSNGCKDGTQKHLSENHNSSNFKVLEFPDAIGYSKAVNAGIQSSTGEYIVLLNNDTVLMDWKKDQWLNYLLEPFLLNDTVGVSGPVVNHSPYSDMDFVIFFCAMISRECIDEIGFLDEVFSPCGQEDIDFCSRAIKQGFTLAQVPLNTDKHSDEKQIVGSFPIYHAGRQTIKDVTGVDEIYQKNGRIIAERYNRRFILCNEFERAVIGKDDLIPVYETARYNWAKKNIYGKKILEIGCSSGYSLRFIKDIEGLDYTGVDYDQSIVDYAKENFGDIPGVKFLRADINTFELEQYDTIIAFEVIEHLDNGREVAQRLKKHCKRLLMTTPYDEVPGWHGRHHKLHHLKEKDFPGFKYSYMMGDDTGSIKPAPFGGPCHLIMMKYSDPSINPNNQQSYPEVTCVISTKDRYDSLAMTLMAVCNQSYKPKAVFVYDDGEQRDLSQDPYYKHIFAAMYHNGIQGGCVFFNGSREGQVANHIRSLKDVKTELIWRLDDDNVPEYDVLEKLVKNIRDDVGAVGGCVINSYNTGIHYASNKIEDIYLGKNEQWYLGQENKAPKEVDHLYSSFVYRKSIAEYSLELSPAGHREETILTFQMHLKGYKNIFDPSARTWHFTNPKGGVRSFGNKNYFIQDERVFAKKMSEWGIIPNDYSFVVLRCGLGDHFAFKSILPLYLNAIKDKKHIFFVAYPEVFKDVPNIELAPISDAECMFDAVQLNAMSIYNFMIKHRWDKSLPWAFKELYRLPGECVKGRFGDNHIREGIGDVIIISPYSFTADNAKSYPYWDQLVPMIKSLGYKTIQIGRGNEPKIPEVDDVWFDLPLKELESKISDCRMWIGVDNAIQHMVNCMDEIVPGIVIFGESDPKMFGYHYNCNILKSKDYLRPDKFGIWMDRERKNEAFSSAEEVFLKIKEALNLPKDESWKTSSTGSQNSDPADPSSLSLPCS